MPCSVLAWDRQVPAPLGWLLPVGGQVMPCLVLAWDRRVPAPSGRLFPVGGQVMPCLVLAWDRQVFFSEAAFRPWEVR